MERAGGGGAIANCAFVPTVAFQAERFDAFRQGGFPIVDPYKEL